MTSLGPIVQDMQNGWRARPLTAVALALLGASVGVASGLGLQTWLDADQESRELLESWPKDRITLTFTQSLPPEDLVFLQQSLPEGRWWSQAFVEQVLWIDGTPPPAIFQGAGTPIPPESIQRADPVAWVSPQAGHQPGELGHHQGIAFRVMGVGSLPEGADFLLPKGLHPFPAPSPSKIEVETSLQDLRERTAYLPFSDQIQLLDHQQKRTEARAGFRRLTRNLTLLALVAVGVTAILSQALIRFELHERRHEFALRRSLGAAPQEILKQILLETFTTTGLPALVGVLLFLPGQPLSAVFFLLLIPGWFLLSALPPARQAASPPPHLALKEG